jgi:hypothetical protein
VPILVVLLRTVLARTLDVKKIDDEQEVLFSSASADDDLRVLWTY